MNLASKVAAKYNPRSYYATKQEDLNRCRYTDFPVVYMLGHHMSNYTLTAIRHYLLGLHMQRLQVKRQNGDMALPYVSSN